jgi:hypothetical protein
MVLGIIAGNIPFANHNQGPRNIFQYANWFRIEPLNLKRTTGSNGIAIFLRVKSLIKN